MDFENIYQEYFKDVFLFLRSISAGEELAQELTQETFMKALKKIDSFDGRKDIRAWLFTIARNTHDTTDFSALRALEILKHLKSAYFSSKNSSFSVFLGSSRHAFSCKHEKHARLTLVSYYTYCRRRNIYTGRDIPENIPEDQEPVIDHLIDEEMAFLAHKFLHHMDEPYKEVFTLRVFGELSFDKIALLFDKTENWARVTFYRAKKQMLEYMEEIDNGKNQL